MVSPSVIPTTRPRIVSAHVGKRWRWVDGNDCVFDHTGPRHGTAPFPRNWKYSYRMEDGFHYDVCDRNQRAFQIADQSNTVHRIKSSGYINLDAHGHARVAG